MTPASKKRCMGRKDIIARSLARSVSSSVEISEQIDVSFNKMISMFSSGGRMMRKACGRMM